MSALEDPPVPPPKTETVDDEESFSDSSQEFDGPEPYNVQETAQVQKRKGGRKPIYATSEERKQRNRQAQAAFRERRTEYIKQLETTIKQHEESLQSLQQSHRHAADECLMLRYKNSLLERILLEKGRAHFSTGLPNIYSLQYRNRRTGRVEVKDRSATCYPTFSTVNHSSASAESRQQSTPPDAPCRFFRRCSRPKIPVVSDKHNVGWIYPNPSHAASSHIIASQGQIINEFAAEWLLWWHLFIITPTTSASIEEWPAVSRHFRTAFAKYEQSSGRLDAEIQRNKKRW
ncbi:MAG: hypothetical protein Q9182_003766 [Xanthomendoza sp. 2 TL-2023]